MSAVQYLVDFLSFRQFLNRTIKFFNSFVAIYLKPFIFVSVEPLNLSEFGPI